MKVFIDGKEVQCSNDVKVIWNDYSDEDRELHMTATYEGVILDRFTDQSKAEAESTAGLEVVDLDEFCH